MKKLILLLLPLQLLSQNCPPACINTTVTATPNGFGVQELNAGNRGCLTGNEHNSLWYTVNVTVNGTLAFTINPGTKDYDFAVWNGSVCPPTIAPIRCSFSANAGNLGGLGNGAIDFSESLTGDGWVAEINVTAGQSYVILVDRYTIPGGAGAFTLTFTGTATLSCVPLPVELYYFKCDSKDSKIELYWSTLSETNNDYFIIQRSIDGINWENIATINGAGNSNYQLYYEYADKYPEIGYNYYRLVQVDINGVYNYDSSIIACYNDVISTVSGYYNMLGQEIKEPIVGVYIIKLQYNNHIVYKKIIKLE